MKTPGKPQPGLFDSWDAIGRPVSPLPSSPFPVPPAPGIASSSTPRVAGDGAPIYTVSELTRAVRDLLERRIGSVWVTGEVTNLRVPSSGHAYFTLKDDAAQISLVLWRTTAEGLSFKLREGDAVLVQGEMTVYEARGQYQLVAKRIEPVGLGALQLAFTQLKERLAKEGLFDAGRKRPLPTFPQCVGIVTSPTGAAIHDMLKTILGRCPGVRVVLCPARVQGDGAALEIAAGIAALNALEGVEVLIVGRGGGSLEDLWPFNEETVARAIAASRVPVISAVGHETDFTIADFVADVRALTPTDAGHLVVPDMRQVERQLKSFAGRLGQALSGRADSARQRLDGLARRPGLTRFIDRLRTREQELDDLGQELYKNVRRAAQAQDLKLAALSARLESLSPFAVLRRGYSLTLAADGALVRAADTLKPGDLVQTRLAQGAFRAKVQDVDGQ